jgi:hypothetical protein
MFGSFSDNNEKGCVTEDGDGVSEKAMHNWFRNYALFKEKVLHKLPIRDVYN